jgi:hypothetical protein
MWRHTNSLGVLKLWHIKGEILASDIVNRVNYDGKSPNTSPKLERPTASPTGAPTMTLIIIIVVLVLLFGGGGGYYAHRTWGGPGLGGVVGLIVVVLVVLWLMGRL